MALSTFKDAPDESDVEYYRFYFGVENEQWKGTEKFVSIEEFEKTYPLWRQMEPHILRKFTIITII